MLEGPNLIYVAAFSAAAVLAAALTPLVRRLASSDTPARLGGVGLVAAFAVMLGLIAVLAALLLKDEPTPTPAPTNNIVNDVTTVQ